MKYVWVSPFGVIARPLFSAFDVSLIGHTFAFLVLYVFESSSCPSYFAPSSGLRGFVIHLSGAGDEYILQRGSDAVETVDP